MDRIYIALESNLKDTNLTKKKMQH